MLGYVKRLAKQPAWRSPHLRSQPPANEKQVSRLELGQDRRRASPGATAELPSRPLPALGAQGASPGPDSGASVAISFWQPSGKIVWPGTGGKHTRPWSSLLARKLVTMPCDALSCKSTSEMHVLGHLCG